MKIYLSLNSSLYRIQFNRKYVGSVWLFPYLDGGNENVFQAYGGYNKRRVSYIDDECILNKIKETLIDNHFDCYLKPHSRYHQLNRNSLGFQFTPASAAMFQIFNLNHRVLTFKC
jgi:hypothetical protein